ncbi:MAG: ABC transporter permease, partial [Gammaproteobacteria bacterium]|nr:ABC transporter permease [Gammaproteobacteria bacterium]
MVRLSRLLALQYLRRARTTPLARAILWLATIGIALGVASLILVLSVMNGFAYELQARLLQKIPHVTLVADQAEHDFLLQTLQTQWSDHKNISAIDSLWTTEVLVIQGKKVAGALLQIDQTSSTHNAAKLGNEQEEDSDRYLSINDGLARQLNLTVGDVVRLAVPKSVDGQWAGLSSPQPLQVSDIYRLDVNDDIKPRILIDQQRGRRFMQE